MNIQYLYPNSTERLTQKAQDEVQVCKVAEANGSSLFSEMLDCVNPLQQLPIVGSIYRAATGETISTGARLIGGAIFGGPIGLLASAVNAGIEALTGGDVGEHVISSLSTDAPKTAAQAAGAYTALQVN